MTDRPTVLTLIGCFTPGGGASGPYQSFVRLAEVLEDRYHLRAVGLAAPGEPTGLWGKLDGIDRIAIPARRFTASDILQVLRATPHDLLWSNGFFDRYCTIPSLCIRRLGLVPRRPMLLSPHGEFSPGALALKPVPKRLYRALARPLGLFDRVTFHATGEQEVGDIQAALGSDLPIVIGPNLHAASPLPAHPPRRAGEPLRIAFLSRIDRKKNLGFAIERLIGSGIEARLDIIGPVSDSNYLEDCRALAAAAPARLTISFVGAIDPAQVIPRLAEYDLFLLPTHGENYGYSIIDALLAGTPLLISDQTPWRTLEPRMAGVDLPLDAIGEWDARLRMFAAMPAQALARWRHGARRLAEEIIDPARDTAALDAMFHRALAPKPAR